MKLRLVPVLVSIVVTSALMFGGWFVYRGVALESPLADTLRGTDGVLAVSVNIQADTVGVKMELAPDANLHEIMRVIRESGKKAIGKRDVDVTITNRTSDEIERWWSESLFDVAEAMDHHKYGKIPELLNKRAAELPGLQIGTSMDEEYVYIRLVRGDDSKFVMLPRVPERIGVWPYE